MVEKRFKNKFQVSRYFDLDNYDELMSSDNVYKSLLKTIIKLIYPSYNKNKKIQILEIGAGTGLLTKELLSNFKEAEITAVEPDKKCCEKLYNQFGDSIRIIQSEGEKFDKGEYDIVVMSESFHHIAYENKEKIIKNILNLLVNNGILIIGDFFIPDFNNEKQRKDSLKKCFLPWVEELQKKSEKKQEKIARKTLELALKKQGEYHLSPRKFEDIIRAFGFRLLNKINVSTTNADEEGSSLVYLFVRS